MAKQPVRDSPFFRLAFHQPELFGPKPLNHESLLSYYSQGQFTQADLELLHGLYLRIEQEALDVRMSRYKSGNVFYLRRDINMEMRAAYGRWMGLWKKIITQAAGDTNDSDTNNVDNIDEVHLQWNSRMVEHLWDELHLLSTSDRSQNYVTSVEARRVKVPA